MTAMVMTHDRGMDRLREAEVFSVMNSLVLGHNPSSR